MQTRCAIYIRVSTAKQEDRYSLKQQREDLPRMAADRGWTCTIYDEGVASAETMAARPQFQRLLADVRSGVIDVLFVKEIERIIRTGSRQERGEVLDLLTKHKVRIETPSNAYNPANENDAFTLDLLFSLSSREKRIIIRRMSGGAIKAAQEGRYLGSRFSPYGYEYDKTYSDIKLRKLVVVPKEAEVVRLIFTMYLDGHGTAQITRHLNTHGYKPRLRKQNVTDKATGEKTRQVVSADRFYSKFICDVLKNQVYLGKIIWNKCHYSDEVKNRSGGKKYIRNPQSQWIAARGQHEPIIDQETFDQAQAVLRQRRDRHGVPRRSIPSDYLLTRVLICNLCNQHMVGGLAQQNRRLGTKRKWYWCSTYKLHTRDCPGERIHADKAEVEVVAKLRQVCQSEEILKRAETQMVEQLSKAGRTDEVEYVLFRTQLEDVLTRQQKLLDQHLGGLLGGEQFKRMNQTLLDEEARLRVVVQRLEREAIQKETTQYNLGTIMTILRNFDHLFGSLTPTKQKLVVRMVFSRVISRGGLIDWSASKLHEPFQLLLSQETEAVASK